MRLALRLSTASCLLFAALATAAFAGVIYVDVTATGANTGGSWADAFTSLQSGLTAAGSGDEIWVAAGTYLPAASDRTASFALKNGVGVYGGFNGTETLRSQRDPVANLTVLSGNVGSPSASNDNSYHVVTADATVTATGVLDGFTLTAGQADGNPVSNQDRGAGMWDNGGSPTLSHVIFTGNFASEGAGLRVTSGAPTILNCTFVSNSVAFNGSGAGLKSGGGSTIYAQNCIFRSNVISSASAGGAGLDTAGNVTLVNCVIAQNDPSGVHFNGNNNAVRDCTIADNTAYGAAFLVSSGNALSNSIFWGNGVDQIFNDGSSAVTATYCDIQGGFAGAGNVSGDPAFLAAPGDLRLGPGSSAVDAGNDGLVPGGLISDIAGLPRFFDDPSVPNTGIGPPGTPIVDMGAYERIPLTVSTPAGHTVCSGSSVVFSVTAAGQEPLTYQWRKDGQDLSNGGPISGVTTPTLIINPVGGADEGSYDILVTDSFDQSLASGPGVLTVNTTPTASATGTANICSGGTTPLSGSGGLTCSWTPTTGLDNPGSCTPNASPAATTTYTLSVTAANGCASTNSPTVTVFVTATPTAPIITAPLSLPVGASGASASVPSHTGSTYNWTLTGGTITGGQTTRQIVFDAGPAGTTMKLTVVESSGGCNSPVSSKNIQVDLLGRAAVQPVPRLRQYGRAQRHHRGLRQRKLLRHRDHPARPDGGLSAQEQVRLGPRASGPDRRGLPGRRRRRLRGRLDRRARRPRCDRRLRQRQLLPDQPRLPGRDGRLPPQDAPGLELRSADGNRNPLRRRPHGRLRRRLHRGPLQPRRHRRLPGTGTAAPVLPQRQQHPGADGGLRDQDVQPAIGGDLEAGRQPPRTPGRQPHKGGRS